MKAVVLVGGEGTRLRPLTLTTPKPLLPVAGRPLIERVVGNLAAHRIEEVILSVGYKPDAFRAAYPSGQCAGVALRYVVETEPLDTGGAIAYAVDEAGIDERFIVVNGDVITELDVSSLVRFHAEVGASATISLVPVEDPSRYGVVVTDGTGRVSSFVEKPSAGEAPTNFINAGAYVMEPDAIESVVRGGRVSVERDVFPMLAEAGRLYALASDSYWIDTGDPAAYIQANLDIAGGSFVDPSAEVDGTAVVVDSVVLGGAKLGRGARIERSIVGPGATVGDNAVIADYCVIGPGASVGRGRHTRRSARRMRTLVTGGAGFIGSTLVDRLLAEGHEVDVLDDLSTGSLANLAEARSRSERTLSIHTLDIRSPDVVTLIERRRPEVVFHLAAQMDVRVSVERPVFDAEVNVVGSLNVLEGARLAGAKKVVFASSGGTIYGDPDASDLPLRESQPQRPISPYGVAKKAVGDYLFAYRELHQLEFTALALANVYGPRQNPHGEAGVVAIFVGRLLRGEACTIFGDGSQTRDYVFVDDVVDAFVRAADERGGGLICNIGTGRETSVTDLYQAVGAAVGVDQPPVSAPGAHGRAATLRTRPGPRRHPARLEALDLARRRHRRHRRLVPHPRRQLTPIGASGRGPRRGDGSSRL